MTGIPNAAPGRGDPEMEIYGMEGIPDKDMDEHRKNRTYSHVLCAVLRGDCSVLAKAKYQGTGRGGTFAEA